MTGKQDADVERISDVPESAVLKMGKSNPFGSVEGLDDQELADPAELERAAFMEQWGPILDLPERFPQSPYKPTGDEEGHLDWGAFGTVDFQRMYPGVSSSRKLARLKEELRVLLIRMNIQLEHVQSRGKYLVLKHLQMGAIELDDIEDWHMYFAGQFFLRAQHKREEIRDLRQHRHCHWRQRPD